MIGGRGGTASAKARLEKTLKRGVPRLIAVSPSRHILSAPSHQFAEFLRAGSGVDEGMRHVKASCDGRITRTRDRFERMRVGEG